MVDKKFAETYPYLQCRDLRHSWAPYDCVYDPKTNTYYRIIRCERCDTQRHSIVSNRRTSRGKKLRTLYRYPTGYQVRGGLDSAHRNAIVLHNIEEEAKKNANRKRT